MHGMVIPRLPRLYDCRAILTDFPPRCVDAVQLLFARCPETWYAAPRRLLTSTSAGSLPKPSHTTVRTCSWVIARTPVRVPCVIRSVRVVYITRMCEGVLAAFTGNMTRDTLPCLQAHSGRMNSQGFRTWRAVVWRCTSNVSMRTPHRDSRTRQHSNSKSPRRLPRGKPPTPLALLPPPFPALLPFFDPHYVQIPRYFPHVSFVGVASMIRFRLHVLPCKNRKIHIASTVELTHCFK